MLMANAVLLVLMAFACIVLSVILFHKQWLMAPYFAFIGGVFFVAASAGTLIIEVPYQVAVNGTLETGVQQVSTFPLNYLWMVLGAVGILFGVLMVLDEQLPNNPVTRWRENINIWSQGKDVPPWQGPGLGRG